MGIFGTIVKSVLILAVLALFGNFILAIFTDIPGFTLITFKSFLAALTPFFSFVLGVLSPYIPTGFILFLMQTWWFLIFPIGLTIRFLKFISGLALS